MNEFIETVKARMDEAQKRLGVAVQKLQAAQVEHQQAAQEFASWQHAYSTEVRRNNPNGSLRELVPNPAQVQLPSRVMAARAVVEVPPRSIPVPSANPPTPVAAITEVERPDTNQTDFIRDILRQHPAGMTPNEIWKASSGQIAYRAYMYSILKRLRDKGEIIKKRGGKYCSRVPIKAEESSEAPLVH